MATEEKKIPDSIKNLVEKIKKDAGKKIHDLNEDNLKALAAELLKYDNELGSQGISFKEILGISDKELDSMYAESYRLYQAGKYSQAMNLCNTLRFLNHKDPKYYLMIAMCQQQLKNYNEACVLYELYAELLPEDPMPLFYSHECRKQLGQLPAAIRCLKRVIERASEKPQHAIVLADAKLRVAELERQWNSHTAGK